MKKNITLLLVALLASVTSLWAQEDNNTDSDKDSITVKETSYGQFFLQKIYQLV